MYNFEIMKINSIAIVGYGITGRAAIEYFTKIGTQKIHVYESNPESKFDAAILKGHRDAGAIFHFESNTAKNVTEYDMVMASPGCHLDIPIIAEAIKSGVRVCNDVSYFVNFWHEIGPVVGVTGSNGKSTTVSLIEHVLNSIGKKNILVGNIGNSPLPELLQKHAPRTVAIMELSSYQLELFQPEHFVDIGVIMNLTENHLDRYDGKMELYADAKLQMIDFDKTDLILVADDLGTQKYILPKVNKKKVTAISLSNLPPESEQFADPEGRALKGEHNLYNIAIVVEVLKKLDIEIDERVVRAIREYSGLEHRIEFVRELDGVTYINDSKSTSVDAMRVALEAHGDDKNIIMIVGGSDKGGSFTPLTDYFNKFVKSVVITTGYDTTVKKLQTLAEKNGIETVTADSLEEAVQLARARAVSGDTVLFSPGGGHVLHMENFMVVGKTFKNIVNNLS